MLRGFSGMGLVSKRKSADTEVSVALLPLGVGPDFHSLRVNFDSEPDDSLADWSEYLESSDELDLPTKFEIDEVVSSGEWTVGETFTGEAGEMIFTLLKLTSTSVDDGESAIDVDVDCFALTQLGDMRSLLSDVPAASHRLEEGGVSSTLIQADYGYYMLDLSPLVADDGKSIRLRATGGYDSSSLGKLEMQALAESKEGLPSTDDDLDY